MYMEGNFQNLCIDTKNAKAELCTLNLQYIKNTPAPAACIS